MGEVIDLLLEGSIGIVCPVCKLFSAWRVRCIGRRQHLQCPYCGRQMTVNPRLVKYIIPSPMRTIVASLIILTPIGIIVHLARFGSSVVAGVLTIIVGLPVLFTIWKREVKRTKKKLGL